MRAKQFLRQYLRLMRAKEVAQKNLAAMWDDVTAIQGQRYDKDLIMASHNASLDDSVIKIMEAENRLSEVCIRCARSCAEITDVINRVENDVQHMVLTYIYLDGVPIDELARKKHYDVNYLYHVHGWALKSVQKILDNMSNNVK